MEMINTIINQSWEIILPKHRHDRPEWTSPEGWERARLDSMYEHIKKGDIVFYCGNEEGDMSGLISQWGGKLVLIEPNELVWPNSRAIWEANKLENPLVCFSGFVCNENTCQVSDITYNRFPNCADGPIISNHGFKSIKDVSNIPRITIDDLVKITGLTPKHICMDIEGGEGLALRGAEKTLREYHPNIWLSIHPEVMFSDFGEYARDLRTWIKDIGYLEVFLDYQHELHELYIHI